MTAILGVFPILYNRIVPCSKQILSSNNLAYSLDLKFKTNKRTLLTT